MEIEYVTEEPEIYDPNFIFFKRIFEAFKVRWSLGLSGVFPSLFCFLPFLNWRDLEEMARAGSLLGITVAS